MEDPAAPGFLKLPVESDSLSPLSPTHRAGLTAVAVLATLSLVSSTTLFVHLTFKLVKWHIQKRRAARQASNHHSIGVDLSLGLAERHFENQRPGVDHEAGMPRIHRKISTEPNQFVVLIYNLLLADMHQAMAFFLNMVWVGQDAIQVRTGTCWVQGWFVSTGDLSASLFITAIGIHTYLVIIRGYRPPQWGIIATCVGIWAFNYAMAVAGVASTNNGKDVGGFYVRAAAWCWMNREYEKYRLLLHYLYIFISLVITSVVYTLIFIGLKSRGPAMSTPPTLTGDMRNPNSKASLEGIRPSQPSHNVDREGNTRTAVGSHHPAFLIYPVVYVVCTLPLALGRIATMAGANVSISYFCAAGALITSNGFLDVLLWGSTRRSIIFGAVDDTDALGLETFTFMRTPADREYGNMVWVEAGAPGRGAAHGNRDKPSGFWGRFMKGPSGWREITGSRGKSGGQKKDGKRSISQESLRSKSRADGLGGGIQMDLVTTVVYEVDRDPHSKRGLSTSRKPSVSSSRSLGVTDEEWHR